MKILLPILWVVLNVLSFDIFSNNYEHKKNGNDDINSIFPAPKSTNKKSKIFFLPEAFEENVEEDSDAESDLDFFGDAGILEFCTTQFSVSFYFPENKISKISCNSSPIAYSQAKYILFLQMII